MVFDAAERYIASTAPTTPSLKQRERCGGKVRALAAGFEPGRKSVRFAEGTESPVVTRPPSDLARLDPPPMPTGTVSASLLESAEAMNRGLQKTNDRLHDDLVALEIKADMAEQSSRDANEELARIKNHGLRRSDIIKMNQANANACAAAIKASVEAMCAAQLEFFKVANQLVFDDDDDDDDVEDDDEVVKRPPLQAIDSNRLFANVVCGVQQQITTTKKRNIMVTTEEQDD